MENEDTFNSTPNNNSTLGGGTCPSAVLSQHGATSLFYDTSNPENAPTSNNDAEQMDTTTTVNNIINDSGSGIHAALMEAISSVSPNTITVEYLLDTRVNPYSINAKGKPEKLSAAFIAKLNKMKTLGVDFHHLDFQFNLDRKPGESDKAYSGRRVSEGLALSRFIGNCENRKFLQRVLKSADRKQQKKPQQKPEPTKSPTSRFIPPVNFDADGNVIAHIRAAQEKKRQPLPKANDMNQFPPLPRQQRCMDPGNDAEPVNPMKTKEAELQTPHQGTPSANTASTSSDMNPGNNQLTPVTPIVAKEKAPYKRLRPSTPESNNEDSGSESNAIITELRQQLTIEKQFSESLQQHLSQTQQALAAVQQKMSLLRSQIEKSSPSTQSSVHEELQRTRQELAALRTNYDTVIEDAARMDQQIRQMNANKAKTTNASSSASEDMESRLIEKLSGRITEAVNAALARIYPGATPPSQKTPASSTSQQPRRTKHTQQQHQTKETSTPQNITSTPQNIASPTSTEVAVFNAAPQQEEETWATVTRRRGKNKQTLSQPISTNQTTHPETTKPQPRRRKNKRAGAARQPQERNVLLVPTNSGAKVENILRSTPAISPRKIGISGTIPFASGALLVRCKDTEAAETLKRAVTAVPAVSVKPSTASKPTVRIHQVPIETTREQLFEDFYFKYGSFPEEVIFADYKAAEMRAESKIAIVHVVYELFQEIQLSPNIRIGWRRCRINTNIVPQRCSRCHLLGHPEKHCTATAATEKPTKESECLDCCAYNRQLQAAKLPKYRRRNTNHPTGHNDCPARQQIVRKKLQQYANSHTIEYVSDVNETNNTEGGTSEIQHC